MEAEVGWESNHPFDLSSGTPIQQEQVHPDWLMLFSLAEGEVHQPMGLKDKV